MLCSVPSGRAAPRSAHHNGLRLFVRPDTYAHLSDSADPVILGSVVAARLLLPLLIFRFPLPGILGCLVLDAADQTIFQRYTSLEPGGYQAYERPWTSTI